MTRILGLILMMWAFGPALADPEEPKTSGIVGQPLFQAAPIQSGKPDIEKTCVELYLEITALLEARNDAQAGFWTDEKNRVAGAAATVFKPAWFYLGYAAYHHLQSTESVSNSVQRVRDLRTVSADKRCFVK